MMTIEQRLFKAAKAIYASAGLTPTPEQEQHTRRDAVDWAADIADGKATEADFLEAVKDTIIDFLAEREPTKTWKDLTEEERDAWSENYITLASNGIPGYKGSDDAESAYPWCAPWYQDWNAPAITPEEAFEKDKEELAETLTATA